MNKFKQKIRLIGYILLIVIAALGIGLVGGIPIPFSNKKRDQANFNIEMVDKESTKSEQEENEEVNS